MNMLEKIQKVFDEREIYYFNSNNTQDNLIYVPYRGIKDKDNHIDIYLEIHEELRIIRFNFIEKVIYKRDDVKSLLLDINATLNFGSLSIRNDSDLVQYRVDYQLGDDEFSFEQYKRFIVCCINTYEKLKEESII